MKILFLNSLEPNQGDFYFQGLKLIVGENNIVEFPYKPLYHCMVKSDKLIATDLSGNVVAVENPAYGTLKYKFYGIPVPRSFCSVSSKKYEIEDFPDLDNYDLVICNFLRGKTPQILRRIISNAKLPIFFIDGEDDPYIRMLYKERNVIKYFKRELLIRLPDDLRSLGLFRFLKLYFHILTNCTTVSLNTPFLIAFDKISLSKLTPLNLTVPDYNSFCKSYNDRTYDLSFVMNATNKLRITTFHYLLRISKKYKLRTYVYLGSEFGKGIPWTEYINIIASSKLSIALPGAGYDTYRYWEIPSLGTAPVYWFPWIKIPNNFVNEESAIFFKNFKELEQKVLYYLKTDKWEEIAKESRKTFLKYHHPLKRAQEILQSLY